MGPSRGDILWRITAFPQYRAGPISTSLRYIKFLSALVCLGGQRKARHFDSSMKAEQGRIELTKLFGESEISARVEEVARTAAARLPGNFVVVGLLVGGFIFAADLVRAFYRIGRNPSVEFMRLNSYGIGRESSGHVRLIGECELDLSGRAVLLVDDIVDTGRTILYARDLLRDKQASRLVNLVVRPLILASAITGFSTCGSAEDIQWGKMTYESSCGHGQNGKGDGPVSAELRTKPSDLTLITQKNGGVFPAEVLYRIIDGTRTIRAHGNYEMPVWGFIFSRSEPQDLARNRISAIIDYLKSIQLK